jgi:putative transposase
VLERIGRQFGYPKAIRVDQGTEFVSRDLDLWAYHRGVTLDFSRPGKPTDNAFIESFNGKFRAECLNAHWFMSLDERVSGRMCKQVSVSLPLKGDSHDEQHDDYPGTA